MRLRSVRRRLSEFIGQPKVCSNLKVFIEAARRREALDHVLFAGPPGLGKTTLAQIVARELGVNFRATSGPVIAKAGDLAALLTNLEDRDVLFIDEIHRLNLRSRKSSIRPWRTFSSISSSARDRRRARCASTLPASLIGATTRTGLLTTPLAERFGIPIRLEFYGVPELEEIVRRGARLLALPLTAEGRTRSRGARGAAVAGRLLRRVRDFASVEGAGAVDAKIADRALAQLEVDARGLDALDHRYLRCIAVNYSGGPVGIETIAAALSEPRDAIEEIIEPYLLQQGFIARTPRGRMLTAAAFTHLGLPRRRNLGPVPTVQRQRRAVSGNWPDLAGRIEGETHVLPIRIYFEDTDFAGVVYHANFLKFCERGRTDFIRLLGIHHQELAAPDAGDPLVFVVRRIEIDYLKRTPRRCARSRHPLRRDRGCIAHPRPGGPPRRHRARPRQGHRRARLLLGQAAAHRHANSGRA